MALHDQYGTPKIQVSSKGATVVVPVEKVLQLRQQGMHDDQIMQALQRDGYTSEKIAQAMYQADVRKGVHPATFSPQRKMDNPMQMNPPAAPGAAPMPPPALMPDLSQDDKIQEIAESIIDERWEEIEQSLQVIIEWKNKVDMRMTEMETKLSGLKDEFDKLHVGVLDRVSEYDQNIKSVGVEMKALEHVFSKILPGFVENVNELSRVADKIKKATALKKK